MDHALRLTDERVYQLLAARGPLAVCDLCAALPYTDPEIRAACVRLEHVDRIQREGGGWRARASGVSLASMALSASAVAAGLLAQSEAR